MMTFDGSINSIFEVEMVLRYKYFRILSVSQYQIHSLDNFNKITIQELIKTAFMFLCVVYSKIFRKHLSIFSTLFVTVVIFCCDCQFSQLFI